MSDLSVVVPTFNEAENVGALIMQLDRELLDIDAEILFVDDSTDGTSEVLRELSHRARTPIKVYHRPAPIGRLAGAVATGIRLADSPWVIVMDADLQHPPSSVPELYQHALLGTSDVVVASRYAADGSAAGLSHPFRRFVSAWSCRSAKLLFPRRLAACTDPMSGFFAIRRDAVELEAVAQCGYKILLAILLHRELTVAEMPFHFGERYAGQSKATFREGLRYLQLLLMLRAGPGLLSTVVGATGVLPNIATIAILTALHVNYLLAAAFAIQFAILWNFAGAELIVFRDRRPGRLRHRAARFVLASETDLLRLPFVAVLVHWGTTTLLATVITLLAAVVLRHGLTSRLAYRRRPASALPAAEVRV